MPVVVAIVGRPNVGKSTLFNRLAGRKLALVHDTPGVTRDRREAAVEFSGMTLKLIDTAGFEPGGKDNLSARMRAQTETAIADADLCLFVIDARAGVTAGDEIIAGELRRSGKPVVLVANKCEGVGARVFDAWRLGFGEALEVSAEHNLGIEQIVEALSPFASKADEIEPAKSEQRPLKLAIVGRPNVGKSSLFNRLLGSERSLTGPEPGLTRDSVAARWDHGGRTILLHDTAGLRKRARSAGQPLEQLSIESTFDAIRFADCAIVTLDATQPFEKQDLAIADLIEKEGRAVVFAANKWDLVEQRAGAIRRLADTRDEDLPQLAGAPLVAISARTGEGLDRLLSAVLEADHAWNSRVATAPLNRFLEAALARHPPPAIRGRRLRIRYITQPKTRPPTFALFGNQLKELPDSYLRYLANGLRETFKLQGAPIRIRLRSGTNPYADG
ncbi:MAG TPA: ribosome biogenesis GTPase Der [Rhizomicrobium sp.]|nr:ribosome biogenesis GTPase Der [Rhizomicrobium sp.]